MYIFTIFFIFSRKINVFLYIATAMRIVFVTQCFKVRDIPWFLIRFETMEKASSPLLLRKHRISKNEAGSSSLSMIYRIYS